MATRIPKLSKAQIVQALDQSPIYEVLNINKDRLTPKQLKFCENLARGQKQAEAYRNSFNTKAKPQTQAQDAYKLAHRPEIVAMVDSIKMAIQAQASYTAGNIKALLIDRLMIEALDGNSSPSARINALKTLGTVAGVDAFIHRSETKIVKDSDSARDDLLAMLKNALEDNARTVDIDADIQGLMDEISGGGLVDSGGTIGEPPPPTFAEGTPSHTLHTIPDSQSLAKPNEVNENKDETNQ